MSSVFGRARKLRSALVSVWEYSVINILALGATIVDALDTLVIMNLTNEFNDAREWVRQSFDMRSAV